MPSFLDSEFAGVPRDNPTWRAGLGPGRPLELLRAYGERYAGIWQQVDALRQVRRWPRWCFLPIMEAAKLVGGVSPSNFLQIDRAITAGVMLASWRMSKGVYLFDQALATALESSSISAVPTEVIFRMPEQCLYIPVNWSPLPSPFGRIHGFFAQIQLYQEGETPQLAICFDTDSGDISSWVDLAPGAEILELVKLLDEEVGGHAASTILAEPTRRALPLLLYLCAEEPDIDGVPRGEVQPTRTKRGLRWFPLDKITTWNVGVRLGAVLRKTHQDAAVANENGGQAHGRPRPHLRRAHFHKYWTGPKDRPNERRVACRWVYDTLVNAKRADDLVETVRPVEE